MEALVGKKLISKTGEVDTTKALEGAKLVGLYFSAHWCPPCRAFTPKLAAAYTAAKAAGRPIEIIFCSRDSDPSEFTEYFGSMPWLAIPYHTVQDALASKFGVRGIPTLAVLTPEGIRIPADTGSAVQMLMDPSYDLE